MRQEPLCLLMMPWLGADLSFSFMASGYSCSPVMLMTVLRLQVRYVWAV